MATQLYPLTADDLANFPNDGKRYEIIAGELHVSPSPSPSHQTIVLNVAEALRAHARSRQLGRVYVAPLDVRLSDLDLAQPDVLFVARDRLDIVQTGFVLGAPDLVVEVLSPSTRSFDEVSKLALYARHRVPEYWLVDPTERTLRILVLQGEGYAIQPNPASVVFPDLTIDLDKLFAELG
jgi:Uma2 family endonuclease